MLITLLFISVSRPWSVLNLSCTAASIVRHCIVVSIPACHAGDRGSIPRRGATSRGAVQKLIYKLPYNMRERWRRVVDDIMELQGRPVKFDDLVSFIDREASIALQM